MAGDGVDSVETDTAWLRFVAGNVAERWASAALALKRGAVVVPSSGHEMLQVLPFGDLPVCEVDEQPYVVTVKLPTEEQLFSQTFDRPDVLGLAHEFDRFGFGRRKIALDPPEVAIVRLFVATESGFLFAVPGRDHGRIARAKARVEVRGRQILVATKVIRDAPPGCVLFILCVFGHYRDAP